MDLSNLLQHLIDGHQSANMLDRTKCSTTARSIYNYLTDVKDNLHPNENLVGEKGRPISQLITDMTRAVDDLGHVFYVHFDHITGDTSHYFIAVQHRHHIVLLQSAVFEFSIHDWLYPKAKGVSPTTITQHTATASTDPLEIARQEAYEEQERRDIRENDHVLDRIRSCPFSEGRVLSISEMASDFMPSLLSLEGAWTDADVGNRCESYARCFSCNLDQDMIIGRIRTGSKPGQLRYSSGVLRSMHMDIAQPLPRGR